MLACVKTDQGRVEMLDLPVPEPGRRDILVRSTLSSLCGSDLHFLDDMTTEMVEYLFPGSSIAEGLPMGHEGIGIVEAVGDDVVRFAPGDRVISGSLTACGRCDNCLRGESQICTGGGRLLYGCQAEMFLVPDGELVAAKVPDAVSDDEAILATDILSAACVAIERAEPRFGATVAIFAQGPVGLCVTAAARARGCGLIIATDTVPERLEVSKRLGANVVLDASKVDVVEAIRDLTGGVGVDVGVEAVGTQATFHAAAEVVRPGGTLSSVGVYAGTPKVEMSTYGPSFLNRRVITSLAPTGRPRMEELLALLEHGDMDLSALFTHRMPLAEAPFAYELFASRAEGVLKVALEP